MPCSSKDSVTASVVQKPAKGGLAVGFGGA